MKPVATAMACVIFQVSTPVLCGSLCKPREAIIFSCSIENTEKVASVCGSTRLTHDAGYLQYRFGTRRKIELEFPATKHETQDKFYWGETVFHGGSLHSLSFINGSYIYSLERGGASSETNGTTEQTSFGIVEIDSLHGEDVHRVLKCVGYPTGAFDLRDVVRDDSELIGLKG